MTTIDQQPLINSTCIELHYLPSIAFFNVLQNADNVTIEVHEHYQKQSYRNRCNILTANGINTLTVPVLHTSPNIAIKDVRLDNSQAWLVRHWRAIVTAYSKAPFFDYFAPYFEDVYKKNHTFLFDLNWQLLTVCLKLTKTNPTISQTEFYEKNVNNDFRTLIHPKKAIPDVIAKKIIPYKQNFGNEFVPNLSIIDLLMCQGGQAKNFLK
jgi:WbqC-like protein family